MGCMRSRESAPMVTSCAFNVLNVAGFPMRDVLALMTLLDNGSAINVGSRGTQTMISAPILTAKALSPKRQMCLAMLIRLVLHVYLASHHCSSLGTNTAPPRRHSMKSSQLACLWTSTATQQSICAPLPFPLPMKKVLSRKSQRQLLPDALLQGPMP